MFSNDNSIKFLLPVLPAGRLCQHSHLLLVQQTNEDGQQHHVLTIDDGLQQGRGRVTINLGLHLGKQSENNNINNNSRWLLPYGVEGGWGKKWRQWNIIVIAGWNAE
jgi:hypothetical protein